MIIRGRRPRGPLGTPFFLTFLSECLFLPTLGCPSFPTLGWLRGVLFLPLRWVGSAPPSISARHASTLPLFAAT